MKVRRAFCALALSSIAVIGVAAPASAMTNTSPATSTATLDCVGIHPVHATALLTARQINVLRAVALFINNHPALFGDTCTVTVTA